MKHSIATFAPMKTNIDSYSRAQAALDLAWLMDMGVDETVIEITIDRFQSSADRETAFVVPKPVPPKVAAKPAATLPPIRSAVNFHQLASECSTVAALVERLNSLEGSDLRKSASNLCFIRHVEGSQVMVIGDKPGKDEDISGTVFASKNNVLLGRMLAAIGISIDDVTLANFIPWRPPGNRAVTEVEVQASLPFIRQAIALVRPRAILALGQLPANRLVSSAQPLTKLRGTWVSLALEDGSTIPLMPTLHPEFLLKQPGQKKFAWRDLLAFKERLSHGN